MAQPKASTIQERFGFQDTDLKSPNHDEIMLWLDANAERIAKKLLLYTEEWETEKVNVLIEAAHMKMGERMRELEAKHAEAVQTAEKFPTDKWAKKRVENTAEDLVAAKALSFSLPLPTKFFRCDKQWESPINSAQYIIGFLDMRVQVVLNELSLVDSFPPKVDSGERAAVFNFEVKTKIPSLGELIRQINMYRKYNRDPFFVVSSEIRFADTLQEQDIGMVIYPIGRIIPPISMVRRYQGKNAPTKPILSIQGE